MVYVAPVPYMVETDNDLARMIERTASLPPGEYKGAILIFTVPVEGIPRRVYYRIQSLKPYTLERVMVVGSGDDYVDIPAGYIEHMRVVDVQAKAKESKAMYSHLAKAVTSRSRQASGSGQVLCFNGTVTARTG